MSCYTSAATAGLFEKNFDSSCVQITTSRSSYGLFSWLLAATVTSLWASHSELAQQNASKRPQLKPSSGLVATNLHLICCLELTRIFSDLMLSLSSPLARYLLPAFLTSESGECLTSRDYFTL